MDEMSWQKDKEMINPQEEYNRLHDHMPAIARERDWLQSENDRLTDELNLAHEAMRRAFPENQGRQRCIGHQKRQRHQPHRRKSHTQRSGIHHW
jgi:hypothetical protein